MDRLNVTAEQCGMKINIKKTKVMKVSRTTGGKFTTMINGYEIEQIRSFKYLGSMLKEDGGCEKEINIKIARANEALNKRK